ncbi:MAG: Integral rane sensor signal transduction histidine kinase [Verrucomicrobiales bacterium]|nr:Integral rane sensor signal transduction histidine kinase [Verrucomicrobiales bacterium]
MKPSGRPFLKSLSRILVSPGLEPEAQASRVQTIERDVVLPIKAFLAATLIYYFYFSNWLTEAQRTGEVALDTIRYLFIAYIIVNVGFGFSLIYSKRLAAHALQWLLFIMGLLDALLLASLIIITGGFSSILYWIFLVLIIHNAIVIPLATPQIVLNLAVVFFYFFAGILDLAIKREESKFQVQQNVPVHPSHYHSGDTNLPLSVSHLKFSIDRIEELTSNWTPHAEIDTNLVIALAKSLVQADESIQNLKQQRPLRRFFRRSEIRSLPDIGYGEPYNPDAPTEPVVLRIAVLVLMTISCYGLQALIERQKRREEEAAEFVVRQEQLQTAGRLSAEIAHQIKNPLAIISNAAWLVQRAIENNKKPAAEQVDIIREEVSRADRIITELMGYAQLAEGRVEKIDVLEEIERSLTRVFPAAANYKVEITKNLTTNLPPLMMQRNHLAEIFVNILQNAREAMEGKGAIRITAEHGPQYSILVTIADTGPGIQRDRLERVFESYYSTKDKGTGLGLAIVKHNVEIYGGHIHVESELGKGAKFVIQLSAKTLMKLTK